METQRENQMSWATALRATCAPHNTSNDVHPGLPSTTALRSQSIGWSSSTEKIAAEIELGMLTCVSHISFIGQAVSGRYVIIQMDNGEGVPLNLREVRAFGPKVSACANDKCVETCDEGWEKNGNH